MTLFYVDSHFAGTNKALLGVFYFNGAAQQWRTDGITSIERDLAHIRIVFTIAHLTQFAIIGRNGASGEMVPQCSCQSSPERRTQG